MGLELRHRGLTYATQVPITVCYKGEKIGGHGLDMIVEGKVILKLKSVECSQKFMKLKFFLI